MELEKYLFSIEDLQDLNGPVLMRVDMNVPVINGKIDTSNPRIEIYGNIIRKIKEETNQPIFVVTHQGRRGNKNFVHLSQHADFLGFDLLEFPEEFEKFPDINLKNYDGILLLDNIRMWKGEKTEREDRNDFIRFMKKNNVSLAINDAIPTWHRADVSLLSLPHIAPTKVGYRSHYELRKLEEVKSKRKVALVIGGSKPEKIIDYLPDLIGNGYDLYTTGIPGQLVSLIKGIDLGEENKQFISKKFSKAIKVLQKFEQLVKIYENKIYSPVDFVTEYKGEKMDYSVGEEIKGLIKDIGPKTVDFYSKKLSEYECIIRAGPSGVYEEGFSNGGELIKSLIGRPLLILGGDSASEMKKLRIYDFLKATGTDFLISGGSAIHYLAGRPYPSLDRILKQKNSFS